MGETFKIFMYFVFVWIIPLFKILSMGIQLCVVDCFFIFFTSLLKMILHYFTSIVKKISSSFFDIFLFYVNFFFLNIFLFFVYTKFIRLIIVEPRVYMDFISSFIFGQRCIIVYYIYYNRSARRVYYLFVGYIFYFILMYMVK